PPSGRRRRRSRRTSRGFLASSACSCPVSRVWPGFQNERRVWVGAARPPLGPARESASHLPPTRVGESRDRTGWGRSRPNRNPAANVPTRSLPAVPPPGLRGKGEAASRVEGRGGGVSPAHTRSSQVARWHPAQE